MSNLKFNFLNLFFSFYIYVIVCIPTFICYYHLPIYTYTNIHARCPTRLPFPLVFLFMLCLYFLFLFYNFVLPTKESFHLPISPYLSFSPLAIALLNVLLLLLFIFLFSLSILLFLLLHPIFFLYHLLPSLFFLFSPTVLPHTFLNFLLFSIQSTSYFLLFHPIPTLITFSNLAIFLYLISIHPFFKYSDTPFSFTIPYYLLYLDSPTFLSFPFSSLFFPTISKIGILSSLFYVIPSFLHISPSFQKFYFSSPSPLIDPFPFLTSRLFFPNIALQSHFLYLSPIFSHIPMLFSPSYSLACSSIFLLSYIMEFSSPLPRLNQIFTSNILY